MKNELPVGKMAEDDLLYQQRILSVRCDLTDDETAQLADIAAELGRRRLAMEQRIAARSARRIIRTDYGFGRHIAEQGPLTQRDWDRHTR